MYEDEKTEILDLSTLNGSLDEDVTVDVSKKKIVRKKYNDKFDDLHIKYKKDRKKYILVVLSLFALLAAVGGSSMAYLTNVSKTASNVTIKASTLAMTINSEENSINMINAIPTSDIDGLASNNEYSFTVKNTGSIPSKYKIVLINNCVQDSIYNFNNVSAKIDKCIPDQYIKVGLKEESLDYKTINAEEGAELVLDTGLLKKNETKSYKMKVWLSHDTPNDYNSKGGKTILYKGKLNIYYEQNN